MIEKFKCSDSLQLERLPMSNVEVRVSELEGKIRLLAEAMNLLLMEGEELPEEEVKEIKSRLNDWLKGNKDEFVDFEEIV